MLDNIDDLQLSEINEMLDKLSAAKTRKEEELIANMSDSEVAAVDELPHGKNRTPYHDPFSIRNALKKKLADLHDGMSKSIEESRKLEGRPRFPKEYTLSDTIEIYLCQGLGIDYFTLERGHNNQPAPKKAIFKQGGYEWQDGFIEDFLRIRSLSNAQIAAMQKKKKALSKQEA